VDKRIILTLALVGVAAAAAFFRSTQAARAPAAAFESAAPVAAIRAPGSKAFESGTGRRARAHASRVVVYVAGEVMRPGVYELAPDARAEAAIRAAGGLRADADPLAVNLARPLEDGEELAVLARGEVAGGRALPGTERKARLGRHHGRQLHGAAGARHRSRKAPDEPVDLNTADAAALETLPGIGPALAARIVEFREANGPFASLDDLLDVAGTSPRLVEELAPYALAGGR
jgi:competence protein ComEA